MQKEKNEKESKNKDTNHKGRGVWRALLVICLLIVAFLVVRRVTMPPEEIETVPLPTVSTGHVGTGDITVSTELIGKVQAADIYYVTPKVAGEIKKIYVEQGDRIKKGDPICDIDNDTAIDSAKISLDSARVNLNTAQSNLNRMTPLYQAGDISAQSYEQAQSSLQAAQLQLDAAQLQYDTQVKNATVTAPVDGTVESENMDLNAMVSQSSQLCIISGEGAKKVSFGVTDRLLSSFEPGDVITVEKQGSSYEGTVTEISGMPDAQTGLYEIQANVADNGALLQGASVKVVFVSESAHDAMILPMDAVYYDGGNTYAYTFEAVDETDSNVGIVHKVEIETGINDGENYEIISGLSPDDNVILTWTAQLYEGANVQLLADTGAAGADTEETAGAAETDGTADEAASEGSEAAGDTAENADAEGTEE